jgi:dihydroorotase-like cyclic amidohydrolase
MLEEDMANFYKCFIDDMERGTFWDNAFRAVADACGGYGSVVQPPDDNVYAVTHTALERVARIIERQAKVHICIPLALTPEVKESTMRSLCL